MGDISTAFVKQFATNIMFLSQQKGSRLRNSVLLKTGLVGEDAYIDQIGKSSSKKKTVRHADVEYSDKDYQRRRLSVVTIYDASLIDKEDKLKMLIDPTSPEALNIVYALGRGIDDEIITCAFGTAYTGKDGTTQKTFPDANVIAADNAGLTLDKLLDTKKFLDNKDVDEEEPRFIIVTGTQLRNLLNTTEVKSADYNTVRALVQGQIDTFVGFKFIRISQSLVDKDADGYRRLIAWAQNGLGLGIWKDMENKMDALPVKHYATQVYSSMNIAATRVDEDRVVEIKCKE